jgi:Fe-S cluster assembly protein SufD
LATQKTLLQQYVGHYVTTKLPGFTALNTALMQEGAVIHVAAKAKISAPIQLLFIQSGQAPAITQLRNLIVVESLAEASVIETYVSAKKKCCVF